MIPTAFKNFLWSAASRVYLHGLCPWELQDDWVLIERREMPLANLGAGLDGAMLVHLSDLHLSPITSEKHLDRIIDLVNGLEPDFVAITGDFITASARHYARRAGDVVGRLRPKVATVGCLGNHDYGIWKPDFHAEVRGLADYLTGQLEAGGVGVLNNEVQTVVRDGARVHLVGVGDLWTTDYRPEAAFAHIDPADPIIALCHNPDAGRDLAAFGADFILAGHTHGTSIPDNRLGHFLFPAEHPDYISGQYRVGGDRQMYVNRGIGHARRVHPDHRPEVTIFTLRRRAGAAQTSGQAVAAVGLA